MSLAEEFPFARSQAVVTGTGALGSCSFRPYLGGGLYPDKNSEWVSPLPGVQDARFGVFLHQLVDLDVTLEGRLSSPGPERVMSLRLADTEVASLQVGATAKTYRMKIPVSSLKLGMNWLTIRNCQGSRWLSMKAGRADEPRDLARGQGVKARAESDSLLLPFGAQVEFSLSPDEEKTLRGEVSAWVEQGAPAVDDGSWRLEIGLADDSAPYREIEKVSDKSEIAVDLRTSADQAPRALAVKAVWTGSGTPLPGQLGLRIEHGRLEKMAPPRNSVTATPAVMAPARKPNVLIYLVDTVRADRLGVYCAKRSPSPRLDAMARDGVVFEQAMATAPWTKPSVASLMTSTEPAAHGVLDFMDSLPETLVTFAEVFQGAGYQTAAFVTNPLVGKQFHYNQGFTTFQEISYQLPAEAVNAKIFPWLDSLSSRKPFLLYVHTLDPHIPYNPPVAFRRAWLRGWHQPGRGDTSKAILRSTKNGDYQALSDELKRRSFEIDPAPIPQATYDNLNALYDGELATNDAAFGALLDALKTKGLYDDTMIVFVSDHGEEILDRGKLGHMHKVYQELMHIPLVVKYPGGREKGRRVSELCQMMDVMPSLLAEAGLPDPPSAMGRLLPLTGVSAERPLFFDIEAGRQAGLARQPEGNYLIDARGVRVGDWTAAVTRAGNFLTEPFVLFDLANDPGETKNLWLEQPTRALRMETLLRRYDAARASLASTSSASPEETEKMLRSLQYLR